MVESWGLPFVLVFVVCDGVCIWFLDLGAWVGWCCFRDFVVYMMVDACFFLFVLDSLLVGWGLFTRVRIYLQI